MERVVTAVLWLLFSTVCLSDPYHGDLGLGMYRKDRLEHSVTEGNAISMEESVVSSEKHAQDSPVKLTVGETYVGAGCNETLKFIVDCHLRPAQVSEHRDTAGLVVRLRQFPEDLAFGQERGVYAGLWFPENDTRVSSSRLHHGSADSDFYHQFFDEMATWDSLSKAPVDQPVNVSVLIKVSFETEKCGDDNPIPFELTAVLPAVKLWREDDPLDVTFWGTNETESHWVEVFVLEREDSEANFDVAMGRETNAVVKGCETECVASYPVDVPRDCPVLRTYLNFPMHASGEQPLSMLDQYWKPSSSNPEREFHVFVAFPRPVSHVSDPDAKPLCLPEVVGGSDKGEMTGRIDMRLQWRMNVFHTATLDETDSEAFIFRCVLQPGQFCGFQVVSPRLLADIAFPTVSAVTVEFVSSTIEAYTLGHSFVRTHPFDQHQVDVYPYGGGDYPKILKRDDAIFSDGMIYVTAQYIGHSWVLNKSLMEPSGEDAGEIATVEMQLLFTPYYERSVSCSDRMTVLNLYRQQCALVVTNLDSCAISSLLMEPVQYTLHVEALAGHENTSASGGDGVIYDRPYNGPLHLEARREDSGRVFADNFNGTTSVTLTRKYTSETVHPHQLCLGFTYFHVQATVRLLTPTHQFARVEATKRLSVTIDDVPMEGRNQIVVFEKPSPDAGVDPFYQTLLLTARIAERADAVVDPLRNANGSLLNWNAKGLTCAKLSLGHSQYNETDFTKPLVDETEIHCQVVNGSVVVDLDQALLYAGQPQWGVSGIHYVVLHPTHMLSKRLNFTLQASLPKIRIKELYSPEGVLPPSPSMKAVYPNIQYTVELIVPRIEFTLLVGFVDRSSDCKEAHLKDVLRSTRVFNTTFPSDARSQTFRLCQMFDDDEVAHVVLGETVTVLADPCAYHNVNGGNKVDDSEEEDPDTQLCPVCVGAPQPIVGFDYSCHYCPSNSLCMTAGLKNSSRTQTVCSDAVTECVAVNSSNDDPFLPMYVIFGALTVASMIFAAFAYRRSRRPPIDIPLTTPLLSKAERANLINIMHDCYVDGKNIKRGDLLGSGSSSRVYGGDYCGRSVALKEIHQWEESLDSLDTWNELKIAMKIRGHPHVIDTIGFTTLDERCYIVMEACDRTLEQLLESVSGGRENLTANQFFQLAIQISLGLKELHSRSVIHRDVKPSNVMLQRNVEGKETAKICDFGLSRHWDFQEEGHQHPKTFTFAGTVMYLAPEFMDNQMHGNGKKYSSAADIYSFAILLWELWYCQCPLPALDFWQTSRFVCGGGRPPRLEQRDPVGSCIDSDQLIGCRDGSGSLSKTASSSAYGMMSESDECQPLLLSDEGNNADTESEDVSIPVSRYNCNGPKMPGILWALLNEMWSSQPAERPSSDEIWRRLIRMKASLCTSSLS